MNKQESKEQIIDDNIQAMLSDLEEKLKIKIKNPSLFLEALTHSSYLNENKSWPYACNERLEFLGDAVLQLCISDYIFKQYPDYPEGKLTPLRSNLVDALMLSNVAVYLNLDKYLFVSKGERMTLNGFLKVLEYNKDINIKIKNYTLADASEAIFGAVYLDEGFNKAYKTILNVIKPFLKDIVTLETHKDSKTLLQELTQSLYNVIPEYKILYTEGPAHRTRYVLAVFVKDKQIAIGEGWSKKEAEEYAAQRALEDQSWTKDIIV